MSDTFLCEDISKIFRNKFIVIVGDSIQRSVYKDMVRLLQENNYLSDRELRMKGEPHFAQDECLVGRNGMHNGVTCREVRQYCTDFHLLRYYYVTRCYNRYMESVLSELTGDPKPDIIIMNSCIWDINRYGDNGINEYKANMPKLLDRIKDIIPRQCIFIWLSTLPLSNTAKGGLFVPDIEIQHDRLRLDILAANIFNHKLIKKYGFDYLDLHYFFRHHIHRRAEDGIHWDMTAHRRMTNMILSHICTAWGHDLPGNAVKVYEEAVMKTDKDIVKFQSELDVSMMLDAVDNNDRTERSNRIIKKGFRHRDRDRQSSPLLPFPRLPPQFTSLPNNVPSIHNSEVFKQLQASFKQNLMSSQINAHNAQRQHFQQQHFNPFARQNMQQNMQRNFQQANMEQITRDFLQNNYFDFDNVLGPSFNIAQSSFGVDNMQFNNNNYF